MKQKAREDVINILKDSLSSRGLWEDCMLSEVPSTVENYGGLLLFTSPPAFSHPNWHRAGEELWALVCFLYNGHAMGIKGSIKDNEFRSPQAKLLFGSSPFASFKDNGILYRWNIEKTMFSKGNVTERHRIAHLDCSDEVVVDLFAGIGYFTIPYILHANAKHVYACEWNPDAVLSLRDNLNLNNIADRCTIYEGDNRQVCPKKIANRVNLGLIPSSEISWESACQALLPSGGVLYVHQNVESTVSPDKPLVCTACVNLRSVAVVKNASYPVQVFASGTSNPSVTNHSCLNVCWKFPEWYYFSLHLSHVILNLVELHHEGKWNVSVTEVFRVKSYAPHVDHLVYTVKCDAIVL